MSKPQVTRVDLLRHGELQTKGLFCALPGEMLSPEGWESMDKITKNKSWDVIISSNYERCRHFAKDLADRQSQAELIISDQFREMDFGRWMGLPAKDIWQQEHKKLGQLWTNPDNFIAPYGESIKGFNERVAENLNYQLNLHPEKSILIITHSGVIRSILATALEISNKSALKFNIDYAQMTRLHYYVDGEFSLQSLGACAYE
jgi:broad specificity phosphatase PhoE